MYVEFGPPSQVSRPHHGPSLHVAIVVLGEEITHVACRVWGFKTALRPQPTRSNCRATLRKNSLCMSSLDHRNRLQDRTAGLVYTQQLSSLPKEQHTLHVEFGPPSQDSRPHRGPSLHAANVVIAEVITHFACRVWATETGFKTAPRAQSTRSNCRPHLKE